AALATTVNDATVFDAKKVNDVLLPEYRDAIATPTSVGKTAGDKLTAKTLEDIVVAVNAKELGTAVAKVQNNFTAAKYNADNTDKDKIAAALKDLNRLADVSADVDKDDIDASLVGGTGGYIDVITTEVALGAGGAIDWTTATD